MKLSFVLLPLSTTFLQLVLCAPTLQDFSIHRREFPLQERTDATFDPYTGQWIENNKPAQPALTERATAKDVKAEVKTASERESRTTLVQPKKRNDQLLSFEEVAKLSPPAPRAKPFGTRTVVLPPSLPPQPDITETLLYGNLDLNALIAPYSLGTNSTLNIGVQLNDTYLVLNGTTTIVNHAFPESNLTQNVVSYQYINSLNNLTQHISVDNHEIRRYYKVVNSNTNYITNIVRNNQTNILSLITLNQTSEIQPFLYIVQTQTNVVNDNGTENANVFPVIESSSLSPVSISQAPTNNTPVVVKYDYDGNIVGLPSTG